MKKLFYALGIRTLTDTTAKQMGVSQKKNAGPAC